MDVRPKGGRHVPLFADIYRSPINVEDKGENVNSRLPLGGLLMFSVFFDLEY